MARELNPNTLYGPMDLSEVRPDTTRYPFVSPETASFLADIRNIPVLSKEEEVRLVSEITSLQRPHGMNMEELTELSPAEQELMTHNLRRVAHFTRETYGIAANKDKPLRVFGGVEVRTLASMPVGFDDRFSIALQGLQRCMFRVSKSGMPNVSWSTFAYSGMFNELTRAAGDNITQSIDLPAKIEDGIRAARTAMLQLEQRGIYDPTDIEISIQTGMTEREVGSVMRAAAIRSVVSLELLRSDANTVSQEPVAWHDQLPYVTKDTRPEDVIDHEAVYDFLDKIDTRSRTVLELRFGLYENEPMTLEEIGDYLGLTRERIRQIEKKALSTLRAMRTIGTLIEGGISSDSDQWSGLIGTVVKLEPEHSVRYRLPVLRNTYNPNRAAQKPRVTHDQPAVPIMVRRPFMWDD